MKSRQTFRNFSKIDTYTFRDGEGNCYVWKTANMVGMFVKDEHGFEDWIDVEIGGKVTMKATIKEHSEHKGTKQNAINRPKFISVG